MTPTSPGFPDMLPDTMDTKVTIRMASLCYTHSPAFLQDFMQSVDDFKDYVSNMGETLRHAAAEAAMGWVNQRTDLGAMAGLYGSNLSLDKTETEFARRKSTAEDTVSVSWLDEEVIISGPPSRTKFDVSLQSPVIILPRKPNSPEVLVGHLGNISIRNSVLDEGTTAVASTPTVSLFENATEKIHMEIRDMNVYSVDLDKQQHKDSLPSQNSTRKYELFSLEQAASEELAPSSYGIQVLHDTVIQLTIQKIQPTPPYINPPDSTLDLEFMAAEEFVFKGNASTPASSQPLGAAQDQDQSSSQNETASVLKIKGKVVTPLKLVLSKAVYEQILQTLDNITPPDEEDEPISSPTSPRDKVSQSSLSALR